MCTHQGARFLEAQLDSIMAQTHRNWSLWVSDDGSTDATIDILIGFREAHPGHRVHILKGPCRGGSANFLTLLNHPDIGPGYAAFADQDDVWFPEKLTRALEKIGPPGTPAIYGARTILTDAGLTPLGSSPLHRRPPGFRNALVQNVVGGNSSLLNPSAVALMRQARAPDVPYHDWWAYLLIAGAGGRVILDDEAVLYYRQHRANALGTSVGWRAMRERFAMVRDRRYGAWIQANLKALSRNERLLTPENRQVLHTLTSAHTRGGIRRAHLFLKSGLYRQTTLGTVFLLLAAALGNA